MEKIYQTKESNIPDAIEQANRGSPSSERKDTEQLSREDPGFIGIIAITSGNIGAILTMCRNSPIHLESIRDGMYDYLKVSLTKRKTWLDYVARPDPTAHQKVQILNRSIHRGEL